MRCSRRRRKRKWQWPATFASPYLILSSRSARAGGTISWSLAVLITAFLTTVTGGPHNPYPSSTTVETRVTVWNCFTTSRDSRAWWFSVKVVEERRVRKPCGRGGLCGIRRFGRRDRRVDWAGVLPIMHRRALNIIRSRPSGTGRLTMNGVSLMRSGKQKLTSYGANLSRRLTFR